MKESSKVTRAQLYVLFACVMAFGSIFLGYKLVYGQYGLRNPFPFENTASYLRTEFKACLATDEFKQNIWRSDCFQKFGTRVMQTLGLVPALKSLALIQDEPDIRLWCHSLGHVLGQQEFNNTGSISQSFLGCSAAIACGEGCFHGVIESYVHSQGGAIDKNTIQNTCTKDDTTTMVQYLACVHGLGHAAMLQENFDIYKSLPLCDYLSGELDRNNCYSGAFMEDTFMYSSPTASTTVQKDDPAYPCGQLKPAYQDACYSSRATFVIQSSRSNFPLAAAFCESIPAAYRNSCYGSFGPQAVLLNDDPAAELAVCNPITRTEDRDNCIFNIIKFKDYATGGTPEGAASVCTAAQDIDKPTCWLYMGNDMQRWHPGEKASLCQKAGTTDSDAYKYCVGAKEAL